VTSGQGVLVTTDRMDYLEAWDMQRRLVDARRSGHIPDVVWMLEHPPTYTYGRNGSRADLFVDDETLASLDATCVASDRGGQMTWHGPGQSVGYAIVDLRPAGAVRRFVEAMVGAMADTALDAGVRGATADHDSMGLYVEGRKMGSVGIRVSGGITSHGLALNRDPDPKWFSLMTACGAPGVVTTSIGAEGGRSDRAAMENALARALGDRLGLRLEEAVLSDLVDVTAHAA
jgi:lipoyl(octanoyl) transferase